VTEEERDRRIAAIRFRHRTHNYAFSVNQPSFDIVGRLQSITVPTLVLVGRHDWITPLQASEEIARHIPNGRLVIFDKSGHAPQVEERERFLGEVRAFLREVFKGLSH
jgi:proline iminopeptidase